MRRMGLALAVALIAACDDPAPPDCAPSAGGPFSLVEGETVTATVACSTEGERRPGDRFVVGALPAGAAYDPLTAQLTWTPALDQAAVYQLPITVTDEATAGAVRIAVADAFDDPDNVPVVDPTRYPEELGLPVLFLSSAPATEEYEPIEVVYGGHTYAAEGKLRGASSLGYPKNSYTLKFAGDHFADPARDFLDKKRVVLTSTFDDNAYVRQRLAYELWNRMDPGHVPVQTYSASVYVDGSFWGLYTVVDHIDDDHFAAHGLAESGNVYKAYNHDANFTLRTYDGGAKQTPHDGYTKKEGAPAEGEPGAFDDLDELVRFTAGASAATFAGELPQRVDVRDFEDWWIFVTYLLGSDSGGKNCYLYHDPAGGPWRYVPWDFNHSFGQDWQTLRTGPDDWDDFRRMNRIFVGLQDDPTMKAALDARYRVQRAGALSDGAVLALYDAMIDEVAGVAARDWQLWEGAYRGYRGWSGRDDFLDHDGEVAYTRRWIVERGAMLRGRFAP